MLTEAYIDYINGPLQIKVGKQIVIWGQLDIQRVADVVNPIDLRKGAPGIDNWEEVKRGIWMIRSIYKSQLPGDLQFEGIFNPGDFRGIQIPYEGTHYGPSTCRDKSVYSRARFRHFQLAAAEMAARYAGLEPEGQL